jgi:hypothetical protein
VFSDGKNVVKLWCYVQKAWFLDVLFYGAENMPTLEVYFRPGEFTA